MARQKIAPVRLRASLHILKSSVAVFGVRHPAPQPSPASANAMVRWVDPVHVPLERRRQTAMVFVWVFLLPLSLLTFTIFLINPFTFWLALAYLGWAWFVDKAPTHGGRKSLWFRKLTIWTWFRDFFPAQLVKTADLDPSKKYVFAYHPHGILSFGAIANFGTEANNFAELFPGVNIHPLTLEMNFRFPIWRDILLALGVASVSAKSCHSMLKQHKSILIVIGGAQESLDAHPGEYILTLKKRKGFVKLALQDGANLVPVFSFGENDVYEQVKNPPGSKLREVQNKLQHSMGFAMPFFNGRGMWQYDYGLLPRRMRIISVVGPALDLPHIAQPTQEDIDHWHTKYMEALEKLFDEHKDKYAPDRKHDLKFNQ